MNLLTWFMHPQVDPNKIKVDTPETQIIILLDGPLSESISDINRYLIKKNLTVNKKKSINTILEHVFNEYTLLHQSIVDIYAYREENLGSTLNTVLVTRNSKIPHIIGCLARFGFFLDEIMNFTLVEGMGEAKATRLVDKVKHEYRLLLVGLVGISGNKREYLALLNKFQKQDAASSIYVTDKPNEKTSSQPEICEETLLPQTSNDTLAQELVYHSSSDHSSDEADASVDTSNTSFEDDTNSVKLDIFSRMSPRDLLWNSNPSSLSNSQGETSEEEDNQKNIFCEK